MVGFANVCSEGVDWGVLDLEGVDDLAKRAARSVSWRYRNRAVASLAEYEDLYQEARILLATRLSKDARKHHVNGKLGLLAHALRMDLLNLVKTRGKKAKALEALEDHRYQLPKSNRPRGPLMIEFPSDGLTGNGRRGHSSER